MGGWCHVGRTRWYVLYSHEIVTELQLTEYLDYWFYTEDDEYVDLTKQGLLFQVGKHNDYMPLNQTRTEGNDDQGFWGLAVMSAAENNFPNPEDDEPQWLGLAQAVFNTQAARWDTENCNGGLRWQIFQWNNGYDYKNSISQACFFALGARLALFTGNQTYADWAEKTWDWMIGVEFINQDNWYVYDGAHIPNNCTKIVPYQFSYNAGGFILGAAAMYNFTESDVWKERLDNLLQGAKVFFTGDEKNIMTEVACEPVNLCNLDQQSFKAYLSRWLAATTKWAPHTADFIMPLLRASAVAAAKQCQGGSNNRMCGLIWNKDKYDGSTGVGQQMAALEVTLSCMVGEREAPYTSKTGGTSKGDPTAGSGDIGRTEPDRNWKEITAGDNAGAAILTIIIVSMLLTGITWIFIDETSHNGPIQQFRDLGSSSATAVMALIGGGGAAAVIGKKRNRRDTESNEKGPAAVASVGDNMSQSSSDRQVPSVAPMQVNSIRETEGHQRRHSNMPLGWAQNRHNRRSEHFDPDAILPVSAQGSNTSIPHQHSRTSSSIN